MLTLLLFTDCSYLKYIQGKKVSTMLGMLLQILLKSMRQNPCSQLPQLNRTLLTRPTLAKGKNANISTDNRNSWSSSRLWNIIEASSFPVENMSRNYQILYSCQLLWPLSSSLEIPNFIPYRLKETILLKFLPNVTLKEPTIQPLL